MRILIFSLIWVLGLAPVLTAQTLSDTKEDMQLYVAQQMEKEVPNENQLIKTFRNDYKTENGKLLDYQEAQGKIRQAHWEKTFLENNRIHFLEAKKEAARATNHSRSSTGTVANPPLASNCAPNIVVIIDRSGSISDSEAVSIRAGLLSFAGNLVGTGSTLTMIGMGRCGDNALVSPTIIYDGASVPPLHLLFIGALTFGGVDNDSWSSAFAAATAFPADLVLVITDGDDGHGEGEAAATCAAANTLKEAGAHLFVFGQGTGAYKSDVGCGSGTANTNGTTSFSTALTNAIDPNPVSATAPPSIADISESDFIDFGSDFSTLSTWTFSSDLGTMVGLGLSYGTWYDVIPVLTLSDGSVLIGKESILGENNDLYFGDHSDPEVTVNDSPSHSSTSMTRICAGNPIFYHGVDPLSGNHFTSIKRKPVNSTDDFGDFEGVGWIGSSLDGYSGDLNEQYPGYFEVGYVYQLFVATANLDPAVCVAWTPVTVEFEIVDCCEPDFILSEVPECVSDGESFTVRVEVLAPLSGDAISAIYSSYPNFSVSDYTVVSDNGSSLVLDISFTSHSCTCEGEMLVFDIIFECGGIWVMTEKLPCCVAPCSNTNVIDWRTGKCTIVNGMAARQFCIDVSSSTPILGFTAEGNESPCPTQVIGAEITNGSSDGLYTICGYLLFEDPDCAFHAQVNLLLETEDNCCTISQNFSFPDGCPIEQGCLESPPNIEVIYASAIYLSLDIPLGQTVTVTNHNTGTTSNHTVETIQCGPFLINTDGNIVSSTDCNGIVFAAPPGIDCREGEDNPDPSIPYHFEISWGNCVWTMIGDYCDEFIIYPSTPNDGGGKRSAETEKLPSRSDQVRIFPNPVDKSGVINFDLSATKVAVQTIRITDVSGKTIESIWPAKDQKIFRHHLANPLSQGVYFTLIQFVDGTLSSTKLVAVE